MTRADCAEIRHRFERERNALLDAKQRETESKLRQEIESMGETFNEKTGDLKDWIVAAESINQQRWDKMDERIWGLYVWFAVLCVAIFLAILFKVDISTIIQ